MKKKKKKKKNPWTLSENEKVMEHENDNNTNYNWCAFQRVRKRAGKVGNQKMSQEYPNYSMVKISQNTEKSSRDLLSLRLQ